MAVTTEKSAGSTEIRPFKVEIPQEEHGRPPAPPPATRWPEKETVADASQGVQLATMQELARYWANEYDFRRFEARLNALPQFITEIDGLDIHFIHVKSPHENALPLIITHGWPGSVIEMLNVVGPLTDPTAHGGDAADAFDVVVPSMPGYGFSGKPTATGWGPVHIADAWIALMRRLGYTRFVAQGGDWGAQITDVMGAEGTAGAARHPLQHARHGAGPDARFERLGPATRRRPGLSADEQRAYDRLHFLFTKGVGYAIEMGEPPQTLYGLADSPVALAAWMLDHDAYSLEDIASAFDGEPGRQPDPRRGPRQHHAHLADEHRGLLGSPLLGEHARLLRRQGRHRPGRGERLPARALSGAAELGRAGLPQPHLLQRGRRGQPLRGLAGARALHRRGAAPASGHLAMSSTVETAVEIRPFHLEVPEEARMSCAGASRRPSGPRRRPFPTTPRACRSRRCRSSRATGRPSTTGAGARRS